MKWYIISLMKHNLYVTVEQVISYILEAGPLKINFTLASLYSHFLFVGQYAAKIPIYFVGNLCNFCISIATLFLINI